MRIGLLVCLSGAAGILGRSTVNAATMAVEELNQSGAFGSRQAELIVADDHTSPTAAVESYLRLLDSERCDVVVASVSSASVEAIRPITRARKSLFLHSSLSERSPVVATSSSWARHRPTSCGAPFRI